MLPWLLEDWSDWGPEVGKGPITAPVWESLVTGREGLSRLCQPLEMISQLAQWWLCAGSSLQYSVETSKQS
jgi:hypothetical protein